MRLVAYVCRALGRARPRTRHVAHAHSTSALLGCRGSQFSASRMRVKSSLSWDQMNCWATHLSSSAGSASWSAPQRGERSTGRAGQDETAQGHTSLRDARQAEMGGRESRSGRGSVRLQQPSRRPLTAARLPHRRLLGHRAAEAPHQSSPWETAHPPRSLHPPLPRFEPCASPHAL